MDHEARIWQLLRTQQVGMLTTRFSGGLRARPLEARPDREGRAIHFIVDVRGLKDDEIAAAPAVCFTLISDVEKAYLSISGKAVVHRDDFLAARHWKKTDDAWWPEGPRDENVRVLTLTPERAELWDGPASRSAVQHEFARARATGEPPNLGENRKIRVDLD